MIKKNKTNHEVVPIDLGDRSYDIHIGHAFLKDIAAYVPVDLAGRMLFVLTDENVSHPHGTVVYESLKSVGAESVQILSLPAGEATKSFEMFQRVMAWMLEHGVNRQSILFTVGGGVIGDLGGFAASVVMRGIPFVQVPTTLLAQVDSSVGGKTGINVPQGKNLVGTFYQPLSVVCDLDTLKTLPRREILAGYAEVVKYGLINDPEFFIWLEAEGQKIIDCDPEALAKAVKTSCRKKAEIVEEDERESGMRALLNLGHTFGHALETAAVYDGRLLHGEAVAIGMVQAFALSHRRGHCDLLDVKRVEKHLTDIGLPIKASMIFPPLETETADLIALMKRDKKATARNITFVLAHGIGKTYLADDVSLHDVAEIVGESLDT